MAIERLSKILAGYSDHANSWAGKSKSDTILSGQKLFLERSKLPLSQKIVLKAPKSIG